MSAPFPRVLVLHWSPAPDNVRNAIQDHLRSFQRLGGSAGEVVYYNALHGTPRWLRHSQFDVIVLHTTLLCMRWSHLFYTWKASLDWISDARALKVALPQDEYDHAHVLDDWLYELKVGVVVSNFGSEHRRDLYPIMHDRATFVHGFTGYIDDWSAADMSRRLVPASERALDIVYRATHLPYWFGSQGQLKHEVGDIVARRAGELGMSTDISTRPEDTVTVNWLEFLGSGKAVVGAESGSSVLDRRGEVRAAIQNMLAAEPNLTFAEVSSRMPPGWDDHRFFAVSPRHFEAVMTKTCQVLVEGHYDGVFEPWAHYIPLARDFSNLDEALTAAADPATREPIADRAYADIYVSGRFTYSRFIDRLRAATEPLLPTRRLRGSAQLLRAVEPVAVRFAEVAQRRPVGSAAIPAVGPGGLARMGLTVATVVRRRALRPLVGALGATGVRSLLLGDLLRLGLIADANQGKRRLDFHVVADLSRDDGVLRLRSVPLGSTVPTRSGEAVEGVEQGRVKKVEWDHRCVGPAVRVSVGGRVVSVRLGPDGIHHFSGLFQSGLARRAIARALEDALEISPPREATLARRIRTMPGSYALLGAGITPLLWRLGPGGVQLLARRGDAPALLRDLLRLRIAIDLVHRQGAQGDWTTSAYYDRRRRRLIFQTRRDAPRLLRQSGFRPAWEVDSIIWDHSAAGSSVRTTVGSRRDLSIGLGESGIYEFSELRGVLSPSQIARVVFPSLDSLVADWNGES